MKKNYWINFDNIDESRIIFWKNYERI